MLKIEKFADVCMTGGMHYTPSHTNVCKFYNFQLTFSQLIIKIISPEMLKLGKVTKFKMLFLVLVFVLILTYLIFSKKICSKNTFEFPSLCFA